ncbi:hypothetical protein C6499_18005 [Candidatus Poribacteria bacterium]|nr:MAG: hypothetical protein C6499_18005 [Candidatus Poribacteria bacterium]
MWVIYQLLIQKKLGLPAECLFISQICVVLLTAPYLAAYTVHTSLLSTRFNANTAPATVGLLTLSPLSSGRYLLRQLVMSQVPVFGWVLLSTAVVLFVTNVPFTKAFQMLMILGIYSISAGAVGMWGSQVFKDVLFGAELATLLWCILIGSAFLINPFKRYIDDFQPVIPLVLHLNPLIVVCCLFEGFDIFRNPALYDLTPVTSYAYMFPKPWYLVGVWQLVIGGCCFLGTWQMCRSRAYIA